MQIQRKRTSLQSQRKRRPSDPRIVSFAVGHMAIGSKTIGKCSDFLTHRFWNKRKMLEKT